MGKVRHSGLLLLGLLLLYGGQPSKAEPQQRMERRRSAATVCLTSAPGSSPRSDAAPYEGEPDSTLRPVDVVAPKTLRETGLARQELDSSALRLNAAHSLAEVLAEGTTLFVKQYGRATESTAEFRGTSAAHTQVMWNGMRINSPMLGTVDFSYLPAYFTDRATLLAGASSLTLTGGALGGAIDLTTEAGTEERGVRLVSGMGSQKTCDEFLGVGFRQGRWASQTRLSYAHSKNDFKYTNRDKTIDERDAEGHLLRAYHPTERNKSGYFDDANVQEDLTYRDRRGGTLALALAYGYSLRGLPFLSVDYKDDSAFRNEHRSETTRAVATYTRRARLFTLTTKAGHTWQHTKYDYTHRGEAITNSRSTSHTAFLQATADIYPAEQWMLTAAVEGYYTHAQSEDRSPFHIGDNYAKGRFDPAASLTARYRPTERVALTAILRGDRAFTPAALAEVVVYKPWRLTLRASVARNYRHPSLDDLYFRPGGNPDLRPERGFTYDGGIEWDIRRKVLNLKGALTAFDSRITNWILWTPNTRGFWVPTNARRVHNRGLEATLALALRLPHTWAINMGGNYAFTPSESEGHQLVYVPRQSANARLAIEWHKWKATYIWTYYSERFTTTSGESDKVTGRLLPYYMSGLTVEKTLPLGPIDLTLKAAISNLLATEYVTVLSRPMPRRTFEIFIDIKWHK